MHEILDTSVSIWCVFDSAGAASEADDEDPDDDGEDLSEVDISLCHDPELLMWTLYSSPDIVCNDFFRLWLFINSIFLGSLVSWLFFTHQKSVKL